MFEEEEENFQYQIIICKGILTHDINDLKLFKNSTIQIIQNVYISGKLFYIFSLKENFLIINNIETINKIIDKIYNKSINNIDLNIIINNFNLKNHLNKHLNDFLIIYKKNILTEEIFVKHIINIIINDNDIINKYPFMKNYPKLLSFFQ